jgi:PAS domain S-box-containing protein
VSGERARVLLLQYRSDNTSVPSALLGKLAAACLSIDTEQTLSAGIKRLRQGEFDAVLLDLGIVNDEGLDALAKLVTQEPHLPVIIMGEIDEEELVARAMRLGAEDYVYPATADARSLARTVRCAIERKRSETTLRERAEKKRALLNALPDMVFRLDPDGRFLDFVPSQDAFPLVSPDEFLGKTIRDVLPMDAAELAMHFLKRTLELGERQSFEYHLTVNDSARYYEARQVPSGDGEVIGFVRDVTESKLASQARRETEARFRAIFDDAAVGIALVDTDGRPRESNLSLRKMLGYEQDELRNMVFTEFTHPDDAAKDMSLFTELVTGRRDRYEMDKRFIHKEGRIVWGHLNVSLVRGHGDVAQHVIAMVEDITERKTASDALRVSEEQLRQAQRVEAVGRLAGGVAHDFNNLLTAMLGYTDIVLDELGPASPLRPDLLDIKKNGQRAAALTRRLLAFSRRQVLQPAVLDLNHVVAGIAKMLRRLISEDIELVTVADPTLGHVKADPGQIEQVIMNLVVNSRDAMPEGGRLTISTQNVNLDATHVSMGTFVKPGPHILLRVSDTGSGMDEETLSRIFEPFFTTKEKGKGTGLGLSTVFGIVKQSGGFVWVESKPGIGTTFDVYLPRVYEDVTKKPRTGSFSRPSSSRDEETILVVEDEASVRTLTRRILEKNGCRVLEARSGADGLDVSERHPGPIDLVISDVVMPELNGPEMIERIAKKRPESKFLYMSGYTEEATLSALDPEIPFLNKPFTAKELLQKVREVLNPEWEDEP